MKQPKAVLTIKGLPSMKAWEVLSLAKWLRNQAKFVSGQSDKVDAKFTARLYL